MAAKSMSTTNTEMTSSASAYEEKYLERKTELKRAVQIGRELKQRLAHRFEQLSRLQDSERRLTREMQTKHKRLEDLEEQLQSARDWQRKFRQESQLWQRHSDNIQRLLNSHTGDVEDCQRIVAQLKFHTDCLWQQLNNKMNLVDQLEQTAVSVEAGVEEDQRRTVLAVKKQLAQVRTTNKKIDLLEDQCREALDRKVALVAKIGATEEVNRELQRLLDVSQMQIIQLSNRITGYGRDKSIQLPSQAVPNRAKAEPSETYGVVEMVDLFARTISIVDVALECIEKLGRNTAVQQSSSEDMDYTLSFLRRFTAALRALSNKKDFVGSRAPSPDDHSQDDNSPNGTLKTVVYSGEEHSESCSTAKASKSARLFQDELLMDKTQREHDASPNQSATAISKVPNGGNKRPTDADTFPRVD